MNYKMTDYDIKRCFQESCKHIIPVIFIDDYWDYYMKLFNLESKYELFKEQYKSAGFQNCMDFKRNWQQIVNDVVERLQGNQPKDNNHKQIREFASNIRHGWKVDLLHTCPDGKYAKIDIHSAWDVVLKTVGVWNNEYNSTMDIINDVSKYDIFKNQKLLRMNSYDKTLFEVLNDCHQISAQYLLKKIRESQHPIIQKLNATYKTVIHTSGDMYMYKVDEFCGDDIEGDYEIDGIPFNISLYNAKTIFILGQKIKVIKKMNDDVIDYNIGYMKSGNLYPELFPLALSLYNDRTPNKYDLAIGCEDQIYFYLNENDYGK